MAQLSIRLELKGATEDEYEALHQAMWERGFRRVVPTASGLGLLPPNDYVITGNVTVDEAFAKARAAAATTGRAYAMWDTGTGEWITCGLQVVTADPDAPPPVYMEQYTHRVVIEA